MTSVNRFRSHIQGRAKTKALICYLFAVTLSSAVKLDKNKEKPSCDVIAAHPRMPLCLHFLWFSGLNIWNVFLEGLASLKNIE